MEAVKSKINNLKKNCAAAEEAALQAENELAEIERKAEEVENTVEETSKQILDLEDDIDAAESRLNQMQTQLRESQKMSEEQMQARRILQNRSNCDGSKIGDLETDLDQTRNENTDVTERCEATLEQIVECEDELATYEENFDSANLKVRELEAEVIQIGNALRSIEIQNDQAVSRTGNADTRIQDLEDQHREAEEAADNFDGQTAELEEEQDKLDADLEQAKVTYEKMKADMESMLAEMLDV